MNGKQFTEMVRSGIKPVVTFTKQIEDQEGYAESGMRAHVLSSEVRHDDVCRLRVSYAAFDEFNKQFESANYYDRDGQATLTARQYAAYQVEELLDIDANQEVPFTIESAEAIALYEAFAASKEAGQGYVAWLEAQVLADKRVPAVLANEEVAKLYAEAAAAKQVADAAKEVLADAMLKWIREKIPDGTVIDLRLERGKPKPDYLHNVTVMSGNSRGTRIFRIERIRFVEPNATHFDLSSWHADATPISMTTGKDMSSTAGNARHAKAFLGLKGSFGFESFFED